jgi:hypothetical protein
LADVVAMQRLLPLLLVLIAACAGERQAKSAPAQRHYALLPNADAASPVKIASIEAICRKVEEQRAVPVTAIGFVGQRLQWLGRVDSWVGQRLVVGVGRLRVELRFARFEERGFEIGEVVEVSGVIESIDPVSQVLLLAAEAAAAPPGQ